MNKFFAELGVRLHGLTFYIDIVNACSLRCPSCSVASISKRPGQVMNLDLFERILEKARSETKIRRLCLYSWSEPLLHKDLPLFVSHANFRGIETIVSTTLNQVNCSLAHLMVSGLNELRISFSGWDQYKRNQRGGDPGISISRMRELSTLPSARETKITLLFHRYVDNLHEEERAAKLAFDLGFGFVSFDAIFLAIEKIISGEYSHSDRNIIANLREPPAEKIARLKKDDYCYLQQKTIALDARGKVYLCCGVYEEQFVLGDFLEMPLSEIQRKIHEHSYCIDCMKAGTHKYITQIV